MIHASRAINSGISIIIPTYGTFNYLQQVLRGLACQQVGNFKVEIVIVYQNRDDVEDIVKSIHFRKIQVVSSRNTIVGASRARNAGAIKARYSLLIFLDDDVIPIGRNWLQNIWNVYRKHKFSVLCGKILLDPYFPFQSRSIRDLFIDFDMGNQSKYLELGSFVPSTQFIIKRSLMLQLGGFRISLDRVGNNLLSGCDDELTMTLGNINQRIYYCPKFQVIHRILPRRTTFVYIYRRLFWQGVTDVLVERHFHPLTVKRIVKNSQYLLRQIVQQNILHISKNNVDDDFKARFMYRIGYIFGLFYSLLQLQPKARPLDIYTQA